MATLAEAMEKRKAELRSLGHEAQAARTPEIRITSTMSEDEQTRAAKQHVRDKFLKWLDVELPLESAVRIVETKCPGGYQVDVLLPETSRAISFLRTLFLHGDYLSVWPLSRRPLWRAWNSGIPQVFHSFVDAALYACGEATVDESGNLELCV